MVSINQIHNRCYILENSLEHGLAGLKASHKNPSMVFCLISSRCSNLDSSRCSNLDRSRCNNLVHSKCNILDRNMHIRKYNTLDSSCNILDSGNYPK